MFPKHIILLGCNSTISPEMSTGVSSTRNALTQYKRSSGMLYEFNLLLSHSEQCVVAQNGRSVILSPDCSPIIRTFQEIKNPIPSKDDIGLKRCFTRSAVDLYI